MPLKINPSTCNLDMVMSPGSGVAATQFGGDSGTAVPASDGLITMTGGTGLTTSATGNAVTFDLDNPVDVSLGGTGVATLTDGGIVLGSGTSAVTSLDQATDGQLIIGDTDADPVLATLTAGTGMTVTNGAGSITLAAAGSTALSFPADSGTATPAANILTVSGGTGINTSGSGATLTVNLDDPVIVDNGGTGATSLTDGGVLLGSGTSAITPLGQATNGQLVVGSTGADPVLAAVTSTDGSLTITNGAGTVVIEGTAATDSQAGVIELATDAETNTGTATDRALTPANITAWTGGTALVTLGTIATGTWEATDVDVPHGGTGVSTLTDGGVLLGSGTGAITPLGQATNGQLVIGSTGVDPVLATLTAGTDIVITEGSGTITIDSTATGGGWAEETGTSRALVVNENVVMNNAGLVTGTLPTTAAFGSKIRIAGKGAGGWKVAQNASELIHFGTSTTTTGTGGSLASTEVNDAVELICIVADTEWMVISSIGNITVV